MALGVMLWARTAGFENLTMPATIAASFGFVAAGFSQGLPRSSAGIAGICGLLCCAAGDILGPGNFLLGAAAFLLAHICFITFNVRRGLSRSHILLPSIILAVAMGIVVGIMEPHVGNVGELWFVLLYWLVLSVMVATAWAVRPADCYLRYGAIIFYLSDIFVARWRYLDSSPINGFFCYPLYYTACLLIGLGIARHIAATKVKPESD